MTATKAFSWLVLLTLTAGCSSSGSSGTNQTGAAGGQTTSQGSLTILKPNQGERVNEIGVVEGKTSKVDWPVFVLVHPMETREWWVQPLPSPTNRDGSWRASTYFGTPDDKGKRFELIAITDASL